jgi:hypothetical protein
MTNQGTTMRVFEGRGLGNYWAVVILAGLAVASVADAASYSSARSGTWSATGAGSPWSTTNAVVTVAPGQAQQIISITSNSLRQVRLVLAGQDLPGWVVGDRLNVAGASAFYAGVNSAPHTYYTVGAVSTVLVPGATVLDLAGTSGVFPYGGPVGAAAATRFDTATINGGHAVTVTSNASVGSMSANSYFDLTIFGSLTVNSGVDFTVRGGTNLAGGLSLSPGSTLEFDLPSGASGLFTRLVSNATTVSAMGAPGSPVTIKSSNPAVRAQGFSSFTFAQSLIFHYVNFVNLNVALDIDGREPYVEVSNSQFQSCQSPIMMNGVMPSSSVFLLKSTIFSNTVNSNFSAILFAGTDPLTNGGQRVIDACSFDKPFLFGAPTGGGANNFSITRSFFQTGLLTEGKGAWASYDQNVCVQDAQNQVFTLLGPVTNSIFVTDNVLNFDPNLIVINNNSPPSNVISGNLYQANCLANGGAFCFVENLTVTTPVTATVTNNLMLPNINPKAPGASSTLFTFVIGSPQATTKFSAVIDHNTSAVDSGMGFLGMVYAGDEETDVTPGEITSLRSNLGYAFKTPTSQTARNVFLATSGTVVTPNLVGPVSSPPSSTKLNAGYNGGFNLTPSSPQANTTKRGYVTGGSVLFAPGSVPIADTTDVDQDPALVDNTRDISTAYVKFFKGTTTGTPQGDWRASLAALQADPTQTQALINWIRAGWTPTNSAFKGTAHDGTTIGAAQMPQ